ncbi:hypothetical protein NEOLEDRAFT_1076340, partial [Neolentinus lepideus HHB14362 ss-1]
MPTLSPTPQAFKPTGRYTTDRREALHKAHPEGFLTSDELALLDDFMCKQNEAFAWNDDERGRFKKEFFPPIDFPVLPHTPWIQRNIPIPPGIYPEVCAAIKRKIAAGVYEPSNASYSLEPLNAVTIQHSGVVP